MYATERHTAIAAELQSAGRVSVAGLAEHFDVTTETVRRDLDALESAGVLRRVHGGAVPVGRSSVVELSVAEREGQHGTAKSAIARAAMRLVPPTFTGSIALDAGTTCAAVASELARWEPEVAGSTITVITNSVPIAATLQHSEHVELHLLGGRVRGVTSAAVGTATVDQIGALRPDVAFIGTNGVSVERGLSTPDLAEARVKRALLASSRRTVVLADHSKFGREDFARVAPLAEVDTVVTDSSVDPDLADDVERAGPRVVVV